VRSAGAHIGRWLRLAAGTASLCLIAAACGNSKPANPIPAIEQNVASGFAAAFRSSSQIEWPPGDGDWLIAKPTASCRRYSGEYRCVVTWDANDTIGEQTDTYAVTSSGGCATATHTEFHPRVPEEGFIAAVNAYATGQRVANPLHNYQQCTSGSFTVTPLSFSATTAASTTSSSEATTATSSAASTASSAASSAASTASSTATPSASSTASAAPPAGVQVVPGGSAVSCGTLAATSKARGLNYVAAEGVSCTTARSVAAASLDRCSYSVSGSCTDGAWSCETAVVNDGLDVAGNCSEAGDRKVSWSTDGSPA
jgi:hypothetical protein